MQEIVEGMLFWGGLVACGGGILTALAGMFIDKTADLVESFSGKRPQWRGFTIMLIGSGGFLLGIGQLYLWGKIRHDAGP
jgi:hypothetical protein